MVPKNVPSRNIITILLRNFYFKERNTPGKCYLRSRKLCAMTRSVVTGIIGIQTTEINGIRDTQTPRNGASRLVEHWSTNAEATGSNLVEALKSFFFFWRGGGGGVLQLLKLQLTAMVTYSFQR